MPFLFVFCVQGKLFCFWRLDLSLTCRRPDFCFDKQSSAAVRTAEPETSECRWVMQFFSLTVIESPLLLFSWLCFVLAIRGSRAARLRCVTVLTKASQNNVPAQTASSRPWDQPVCRINPSAMGRMQVSSQCGGSNSSSLQLPPSGVENGKFPDSQLVHSWKIT